MSVAETKQQAESAAEGKIRRVLICGVSGYLGSALAVGLRNEFEVLGTYHTHPVRIEGVTCFSLNCTNGGEILEALKKYKPDAVIYAAGVTDHATSTASPNLAESLHFKAPTVFFKILPLVLRFVFVSTDESIGAPIGISPPFDENVVPRPLTVLGKTRHQGEGLTVGHKKYTATFRLSEVYGEPFGWSALGHHAARTPAVPKTHWLDQLHYRLQKKQKTPVPSNIVRNYLYVGDFVRAMRLYLHRSPVEAVLYHMGGPDSLSQFDFARQLSEKLGYDPALVVANQSPIPTDFTMNAHKFNRDYGFSFQGIEDGLGEYVERLRTGHTKDWR